MLKLPHEKIFKTLVTIGTDKNYYVAQAKELESMIVSGGRIGSQIELKPFDLCEVTNASFEEICFKQTTR